MSATDVTFTVPVGRSGALDRGAQPGWRPDRFCGPAAGYAAKIRWWAWHAQPCGRGGDDVRATLGERGSHPGDHHLGEIKVSWINEDETELAVYISTPPMVPDAADEVA